MKNYKADYYDSESFEKREVETKIPEDYQLYLELWMLIDKIQNFNHAQPLKPFQTKFQNYELNKLRKNRITGGWIFR